MAALDFPDTPTVGQLYGSSGTVWRWDGARWASTAGASGARGRVAYAEVTASQASIGASHVTIAGLTATWVADPTRTYLITVQGEVTNASGVANDVATSDLRDGVTRVARWNSVFASAGQSETVLMTAVQTGLSGTQTRTVTATKTGTAGMTWQALPTIPSFILVEDITYEAGTSGTPGAGGLLESAPCPLRAEMTGNATVFRRGGAVHLYVSVNWVTVLAVGQGLFTVPAGFLPPQAWFFNVVDTTPPCPPMPLAIASADGLCTAYSTVPSVANRIFRGSASWPDIRP